ncbi:hypothetical protein [Pseudomonas sp. NPDC089569]|uniref:hypothetical protein n=1 Tax=Pseudomonas sp. NPDC089569 TaxID=3390722 RepID=UPI003D00257F
MKALTNVIARTDAALNKFWIGTVLRGYHQVQAASYSRKARRLASISVAQPAYAVVRHQAARHQLEAELIGGML